MIKNSGKREGRDMNRISLVGRLRTQKLLGRTVLILLAFSLLTVGGS